ncbi:MFS family permease [Sporomusaceae bacterium BoRhaA]|uniref:MFS transporter n=1 Tax=Pelorhabdus rhamnosifermentans TaxID=2772457 RepID=UPI001C06001D|nr:MFS transporter [Pelorhabdus rhamnosifermentans]MBU2704160.1 MFS family permease [Pelorhabdus rhamnosifermentans]
MDNKWIKIAGTLMLGLFVAYMDRTNLSVGLPSIAQDFGFAGANFAVTSSLVLTTFLVGYAVANVFGGIIMQRFDPKWVVIWMLGIWSLATMLTGFVTSITLLIAFRFALGVTEGIYWPQQSRFARAWFAPDELTRANSIIQYYGQFLALALGFIILTPIYDHFGWQTMFFITGGVGLFIMVPLYVVMLKKESEAPFRVQSEGNKAKLTMQALGGPAFLLLLFSYISQGMLFWGITLWIPMVVKSLGFTGTAQAVGSALPYIAAVILAIPMSIISDKTGKRVLIAALGLLIPGILLILLPQVEGGYLKLGLITVALGYYASSFTPNIWSILQSSVEPEAVGPASGIINGLGAGGGGTLAGFLVGLLKQSTGSYMSGFVALGIIVVLGGISLLIYGKIKEKQLAVSALK